MKDEKEQWKPVVGYKELYEVSNLGNVRSLPRKWVAGKGVKLCHKGKTLNKTLHSSGYYVVTLSRNKVQKQFKVHTLVAMAFLNHKPNGFKYVIDHIDNNRGNNALSNLQIVTHRVNATKDRKSKYMLGVTKDSRYNTYSSRIFVDGRNVYIGSFKCETKAHLEYVKYKNKLDDKT